jgi:hypothetical protein
VSSCYSEQITPFQVNAATPDDSSASTVLRPDWPKIWGAERILRCLIDNDGVLLAKGLPKLTDVAAEDFRLLQNSKGTTWTETGGAIGADIDALPPLALSGGVAKPAPKTDAKSPAGRAKTPSF